MLQSLQKFIYHNQDITSMYKVIIRNRTTEITVVSVPDMRNWFDS